LRCHNDAGCESTVPSARRPPQFSDHCLPRPVLLHGDVVHSPIAVWLLSKTSTTVPLIINTKATRGLGFYRAYRPYVQSLMIGYSWLKLARQLQAPPPPRRRNKLPTGSSRPASTRFPRGLVSVQKFWPDWRYPWL